jgi:hypothetical protein
MKFLRRAFLLALLTGLAVPATGAVDRDAFTFTSYSLGLRIEPQQQRLAARGYITMRNDSPQPQRLAALQISSSLSWRSIRVADQTVQFLSQPYTSDIDHTGAVSEAIVTLPREVPPKGSVELEIGYEGVVVLNATRLTRIGTPEEIARHSDWDQIGPAFTALRGIGYVVWYPVAMEAQNLSEGGAMFWALGKWKARHANSAMTLSFATDSAAPEEKPLATLCNTENPTSTTAGSTATCSYAPLGNTVPTLFVGRYDLEDAAHGRVFHRPEHKSVAAVYAGAADEEATFVAAWFGEPRRKALVVDLADGDAAPYETASVLAVPLTRNDTKMAQELMAHQLAHAAINSPRLWIYEGIAHLAQALALEQQTGRDTAQNYLALHRAAVMAAEKESGQTLSDATDEVFYRSKAALVWWMLRDLAGEEALKQTLHAYKPEQDQDPKYFENLLQAHTKRDLGWFFQDWVYTDAGLPDFHIESANTRKMPGESYVTAVTIENLGSAGAEVPVFVHTEKGDFTDKLEVRGKSKAVIRIATPAEPLEIRVNDGRVPETDLANNSFKIKNKP